MRYIYQTQWSGLLAKNAACEVDSDVIFFRWI